MKRYVKQFDEKVKPNDPKFKRAIAQLIIHNLDRSYNMRQIMNSLYSPEDLLNEPNLYRNYRADLDRKDLIFAFETETENIILDSWFSDAMDDAIFRKYGLSYYKIDGALGIITK